MALTPFFGRSSLFPDPFSASLWDPFSVDTEPAFSFAKDVHALVNTRIDWKETDDAHIITADLPGVKKEDLKVDVVDNCILTISGERCKEEVNKNDKWHKVERASGKFLRSFRLPDNVNTHAICAKFENGVLVVTLPKVKAKASEVKSIDIGESEECKKCELEAPKK